MSKTDFKPNYAVSPMETLRDMCLYQTFGSEMIKDFEKGITEKNVYLIAAMFPETPRKFWLNLQKNYNETVKRLEIEKGHTNGRG